MNNLSIESVSTRRALTLNVPNWFKDESFLAWLNSAETIMSWHTKGEEASDFSDTAVFVDPDLSGDGSEAGVMPDVFWNQIIEQCKTQFWPSSDGHIVVILTNLV
tara:strand:+ start:18703 stop:19017 length:315 start_codon:yes stop_codon:yes gene_type:complete